MEGRGGSPRGGCWINLHIIRQHLSSSSVVVIIVIIAIFLNIVIFNVICQYFSSSSKAYVMLKTRLSITPGPTWEGGWKSLAPTGPPAGFLLGKSSPIFSRQGGRLTGGGLSLGHQFFGELGSSLCSSPQMRVSQVSPGSWKY